MVRDTAATRLTLGALLVGAFTLAVLDSHAGAETSPLRPVRSAAASALSPLQGAMSSLADPFVRTVGAIGGAHDDARRVAELAAQNVALQAQLRDALAQSADVYSADALRAAAAATTTNLTVGHVFAINAVDGYSWTIAVDRGAADGVVVDSTVLDEAGLVGRVVAVTEHVSTVLLVADPISTVGVRMAQSQEIGTLDGTGGDLLRLTLFNPNARISPGEELRTFGSPGAGPYPAGLPIGQVVEVTNRSGGLAPVATVRPYARLSALAVVGIVTPP
ncbi:MAG TPA: rod shape-determining protein MreC [Sporichthya sp.]|nr:rod shape-determining protein MreC [Sporichthya sp.]